jgi:uncharacterized protein (TIGR02246 family)
MRGVVVMMGMLALAGCQTAAPVDTSADLKSIEATRMAYAAAFNAEDAAKTAALYTIDGVYMSDNAQQVIGRDGIRAAYEKVMAGMDCDVQLKAEETIVNGDWAFERGQTWLHIMSKDPKSTLPMIMDQGKYLVVLRKQPDNTWLIARAMSNSNIGLPPAPAATPAAK